MPDKAPAPVRRNTAWPPTTNRYARMRKRVFADLDRAEAHGRRRVVRAPLPAGLKTRDRILAESGHPTRQETNP